MRELVSHTRSFCTFRLGPRLYGIDVAQVREVSPLLPMTPVPQAPPAVHGLFNLRSRIYLALDLRPLLTLPVVQSTPASRLLILRQEIGQDLGVLVEIGGDIVHAPADSIEASGASPDPNSQENSSLVAGACKLPGELMIVVDVAGIARIVSNLMRHENLAALTAPRTSSETFP